MCFAYSPVHVKKWSAFQLLTHVRIQQLTSTLKRFVARNSSPHIMEDVLWVWKLEEISSACSNARRGDTHHMDVVIWFQVSLASWKIILMAPFGRRVAGSQSTEELSLFVLVSHRLNHGFLADCKTIDLLRSSQLKLQLQPQDGFLPINYSAPNSISASPPRRLALFDSSFIPDPDSAVPHQTSKQKGIFHYSNAPWTLLNMLQ